MEPEWAAKTEMATRCASARIGPSIGAQDTATVSTTPQAGNSHEVRNVEWGEVDWESATWTIPACRMKTGKRHRVPVSNQAMVILQTAWEISGQEGGLIFPAPRSGKAMTDMTLTALLRRLEIDAVPHGFRSSFRDWAAECSGASWAVCESALSHIVGNTTEQAYMLSDLFQQRRELKQQGADYLVG